MTASINDIRLYFSDEEPAALVAIGFDGRADAKAAQHAREHGVTVNVLQAKDGYELRAKIAPSGLRIDVADALKRPQ